MSDTGSSSRLQSLDAFRGATIAAMILVNNPGSWDALYPQLAHARWNGWTMTDLIFPFFLWIVGVAMTFSFAKRKERGDNKGRLLIHVLRRAVIIAALGLFLNGFPFGLLFGHEFSLSTLRIPGVLQRIAACYLFASMIFLYCSVRAQIWWTAGLLASYWVMLMLIPVPGYGAGHLEPTGNLCWFLDSNLLAGHTWSGAPAPGFDPEGILSTIPAIGTTLLGILTGHWLRTGRTGEDKAGWMFVAGNVLMLTGAILDMWLPINKNLWTSSYVIFMAGWALVVFAVFFWLMDVKGYTKWARPFAIYGMNAIVVYVLSGILARVMTLIQWSGTNGSTVTLKGYVYSTFFVPNFTALNASVMFAICFIMTMFVVVWLLWRKQWFLKV